MPDLDPVFSVGDTHPDTELGHLASVCRIPRLCRLTFLPGIGKEFLLHMLRESRL